MSNDFEKVELHGGPLDGLELFASESFKLEELDPETGLIHVYVRRGSGVFQYAGHQPSGLPPALGGS
jgi:hypothetical protein